MESKRDTGPPEVDIKAEVKQEPWLMETSSTELKCESEVIHGSNIYIKSEPACFASDLILQTDTAGDVVESETKIEIKEEPVCLERTPSESEEIQLRDEDNVLEKDGGFILPDSGRFNMEAVWKNDCDVANSSLEKDYLNVKENNRLYHGKTAHTSDNTETISIDDRNTPKCDFCGKCFTLASDLQIHILTHGNEMEFKCSKCDKSFARSSHLKQHALVHAERQQYKCNLCEKSYAVASNLRDHILVHEGRSPHKCNICGKFFTRASTLKMHILIHKGIRPYKCDRCDRSFYKISDLYVHNLIHDGKNPFKCDKCDKTFTTSSNFNTHSKIHDDKRQLYQCNVCEKSFKGPGVLKSHILVHEGESPHKCSVCGKVFTQATNLKAHLLIHYGKCT